jgi:hypothetical protein
MLPVPPLHEALVTVICELVSAGFGLTVIVTTPLVAVPQLNVPLVVFKRYLVGVVNAGGL